MRRSSRTPCRFLAAVSAASDPLPRCSLCRSLTAPSATMPPRRRGSSGYRGVRERPSAVYYIEIRSGDVRLGLDTFETSHEAARAYDAAA
ncbi:putative AP2 protein [Hordeum vulgare]|nr:putative AP2 protein [Hordeum vulgare]